MQKKKCKICGKPFTGEGEIGPTCLEHQGEVGRYYKQGSGLPTPTEFISLVELCDEAQRLGKTRYWAVKLTGGDGGVKPPHAPEFIVYLFGRRKYCRRAALSTMKEFAKTEMKG